MTKLMRPEFTMPEAEAAAIRDAYAAADSILEYGSGGSTVMASELPGKRVISVESDRAWARMMERWLKESPPAEGTDVIILWENVGVTKEWGHPADDTDWRAYPRYPLRVWQKHKPEPDVVLVDGRFRIGCALAAAYLTTKPIVVFFDDYDRREAYHRVEDFLGPPEMIGRMARFDVTPGPIPKDRLLQVTQFMYRPL